MPHTRHSSIRQLVNSSILLLLIASPTLRAESPTTASDTSREIELQRKLDQPINLTLGKIDVAEAFKQIAATAQISINVDPACYDALPYGSTIRVSADFRQSKLRDAIEQVLVPLGLQQTVSASTLIIRPSAPLARIGRRAQWDELTLLQDLRTSPDIKANPAAPFDFTAAFRAVLDNRPNLVVAITGEPGGGGSGPIHDKAIDQLKKQLPLSPFRALELYCQFTHQVWFVESPPAATGAANNTGGTVRIMPERRWLDRQLQRPIQLSFTNAPLDQVVAELSHTSGIRFTPEPGLYQAIPLITLNSNNASVLQTLETLSGNTSIAFDIRDDSIYLHSSTTTAPAPTIPGKTDAIVARIAVPVGANGMSMDILIHESELSPELNDIRKKKIQESLEALQKAWSLPTTPTPPTPPAPATTSEPAPQPEPK